MINELFYFIISLILVLVFIYFTIKLIDQWKIKRLRKKYPEGTETKTVPVDRLDDVPTIQISEEERSKLISQLLE